MAVKSGDLHLLAMLIEDEIKKEFNFTYLSGNLKNTVRVEIGDNNTYNVIIAAQRYDVNEWKRTGVKVYEPGSYASAVDKTGGFSKKHTGYVEKCINKAVDRWLASKRDEYKLVRRV